MNQSVNVHLTINIDKEEFHMSTDDDVESDVEDMFRELIHDLDGIEINKLTVKAKN